MQQRWDWKGLLSFQGLLWGGKCCGREKVVAVKTQRHESIYTKKKVRLRNCTFCLPSTSCTVGADGRQVLLLLLLLPLL